MIGIVVDLLEKKAFLSMVLLILAFEKHLYYQRIALVVTQWAAVLVGMIEIVVDLLEKQTLPIGLLSYYIATYYNVIARIFMHIRE